MLIFVFGLFIFLANFTDIISGIGKFVATTGLSGENFELNANSILTIHIGQCSTFCEFDKTLSDQRDISSLSCNFIPAPLYPFQNLSTLKLMNTWNLWMYPERAYLWFIDLYKSYSKLVSSIVKNWSTWIFELNILTIFLTSNKIWDRHLCKIYNLTKTKKNSNCRTHGANNLILDDNWTNFFVGSSKNLILSNLAIEVNRNKTESGDYEVKDGYKYIYSKQNLSKFFLPLTLCWDRIFLLKVGLFLWAVVKGRILTMKWFRKFGYQGPSHCPLCEREKESMDHLLLNCVFFG